jgi:hypothetical protein
LPGNSWVIEKRADDGTLTILPLVGWLVTDDGELLPLPRSLDASWITRPRTPDDDRVIASSAARMRPKQKDQRSYYENV